MFLQPTIKQIQDNYIVKRVKARDHSSLLALMKAGYNKDAKDENQHSLLMIAAQNNDPVCTNLLCLWRANLEAVDKNHKTALILAIEKGYSGIAERLISAGANIAHKDNTQKFPLDYAQQIKDNSLIARITHELAEKNRSRTNSP